MGKLEIVKNFLGTSRSIEKKARLWFSKFDGVTPEVVAGANNT